MVNLSVLDPAHKKSGIQSTGLKSGTRNLFQALATTERSTWLLKELPFVFMLTFTSVPVVPISAQHGDNVVEKSSNSPWYKGWKKAGQSGITLLEAIDASLQT